MNIAEFFKLVRESCSSVAWSRGVELSREGGVLLESGSVEGAILRVSAPDRPISATVSLLFEDEDWICDCRGKASPCEHVAAAVIAYKRARESGKALAVSTVARGVMVYVFFEKEKNLALERRVRFGERETVLTGSVSAQVAGEGGASLSASKEDWTIESLMGDGRREPLSPAKLADIFAQLRNSRQVLFDNEPTEVSVTPVPAIRAVFSDVEGGDGVRLTLGRNPEIVKRFENGAALCADGLRAVLSSEWTSAELAWIKAGSKIFPPSEFAALVADLIPQWKLKAKVTIASRRLPQIDEDLRPRLVFNTAASGDQLSVLPLIVYGNPPVARVDNSRLVFVDQPDRVPLRQLRAEKSLATTLHSQWGLTVGRRVDYRAEAAARFEDQMRRSRFEVVGKTQAHFGIKPSLVPMISFTNGKMEIGFSSADGGSVDANQVFQAWKEGFSRVTLTGGQGWAPVPGDWLDRYGHRVLALLEAKDKNGELPAFYRPEAARFCEELGVDCPPDFSKLRRQLETFEGITDVKLPDGFSATLRGYQRGGVNWLGFLRDSGMGALLADDMGLGKSVQTIAVLSGRSLIVSPTSVMTNWEKEIRRFHPALSVSRYHGPARELDPKADVTLTTYAILRLDRDKLGAHEWDNVVLDEAQYIKNAQSQAAQAAFAMPAKFRVALTGTPVENRPEDLWSLFQFLNPGLLGSESSFQKSFWTNDAVRVKDLHAKIRPFILRRLKKDVAPELPPRTETVLYCELSKNEQANYDAVKAATQKTVLEEIGARGNVMAALESLLRLRQAACHGALLPGVVASDSSKINLLRQKLEEVVGEGHKALVFSQWTSLLDLIEPELRDAGIGFSRIDGSTVDRQAIIDDFQSPQGKPVLLMTLKAGGVGLNLTAADHVFLVDPWWNPAAEDQAADRAHRIGQTRPVFVHRLVARGTVEEKILLLQESKRQAADAILTGTDSSTGITRDELLELLR